MKPLIPYLSILFTVVITESSAIEKGQLVIVDRDSVALRLDPNASATPSKYAMIGLQLRVLDITHDGLWYKVKIGEQKGYQLRHEEEYWVRDSDVFKEPSSSRVNMTLDVSILQQGDLAKANRISHHDYIHKQTQINLADPYYVACTYKSISPDPTCSPPLSICAQIFKPKEYFRYDNLELASRYEGLFENGMITPFYSVTSKHRITMLSERIVLVKVIMRPPGCYAERYSGTEFYTLRTRTVMVNEKDYFSTIPVETAHLFESRLRGGVQNVYFLFVLHFTFDDDTQETLVRRIVVWWPMCL